MRRSRLRLGAVTGRHATAMGPVTVPPEAPPPSHTQPGAPLPGDPNSAPALKASRFSGGLPAKPPAQGRSWMGLAARSARMTRAPAIARASATASLATGGPAASTCARRVVPGSAFSMRRVLGTPIAATPMVGVFASQPRRLSSGCRLCTHTATTRRRFHFFSLTSPPKSRCRVSSMTTAT